MRSLLFAPGGSAKMMAKAVAGDADAVILDLEDAVHPDKKEAARHLVAEALTAIAAAARCSTSGSTRWTVPGAPAIWMR